jgi:predicted nucleic acid-binding protein
MRPLGKMVHLCVTILCVPLDIKKIIRYYKLMEMIVDASAIMAVIAQEPERDTVIQLTKGAKILSPAMVSYEIANGLTKMVKKKIIDKERMLNIYKLYKNIPIRQIENNITKALEIAWNYKIYAYDACYLESAKRLTLPLLTFDSNMAKIGNELGITILGG